MRPDWEEYFMELASIAAKRSTCLRRQVGAVIVRDHRVLATGYNGAPKGLAHCEEVSCLREFMGIPSGERAELCRAVHAEQNAIIQAAVAGISILDSEVYITHFPCVVCAKMLINAGVYAICYIEGYPDELSKTILSEAGTQLRQYQKRGSDVRF